ncbi:MAG: response regulator transcription factor [Bacteroidia bacterium]|nr:response regulator transcription factor [Bacteroidia bacterium]
MIKIVLIEDDNGIRECLADFLNMQHDTKYQTRCIGSFSCLEDFLKNKDEYSEANIVLLDINLPGMTGLTGIKYIKAALPDTDIIMLTIHNNSDVVFQALCAGATGYLLKGASLPFILDAIIQQYEGGAAMSPSIARMVISTFGPKIQNKNNTFTGHSALSTLTPRELQVVQALADGLSYKLVADRLQISTKTVPVFIKNIYTKLQVNSKSEVVSIYLRNQLKL